MVLVGTALAADLGCNSPEVDLAEDSLVVGSLLVEGTGRSYGNVSRVDRMVNSQTDEV